MAVGVLVGEIIRGKARVKWYVVVPSGIRFHLSGEVVRWRCSLELRAREWAFSKSAIVERSAGS